MSRASTARSRPGAAPGGPGQPSVWEQDGRTWVAFGAYDKAVHFLDGETGERHPHAVPDRRHHQGLGHHRPRRLPAALLGLAATTLPRARPRPGRGDRGAVVAVGRRGEPHEVEQRLGRLGARHRRLPVRGRREQPVPHREAEPRRRAPTGRSRSPPSSCSTPRAGTTSCSPPSATRTCRSRTRSPSRATPSTSPTPAAWCRAGTSPGWPRARRPTADVPVLDRRRHRRPIVIDDEGMLYVGLGVRAGQRAGPHQIGQLMKLDPSQARRPARVDGRRPRRRCRRASGPRRPSHDGMVYVATNGGRLLGVDQETGEIRWEKQLPGPDVAVAGGRRRRADRGRLQRRAARLRRVRARRATRRSSGRSSSAGCIESTPAVWNGRIYVGTRAGRFCAIGDR